MAEGETITIRLVREDGSEVYIEDVPTEKWDRFCGAAKCSGQTVDDLFLTVLDEFLRSKGY